MLSALKSTVVRDDRLDQLFGALSDRTRRALLARLARGPSTVTELAAPFAMTLAAVSKHLRVLEAAGLVARTIDGRVHRLRLEPHPLHDAERWLAFYRDFWTGTLDHLARHVESRGKDR